MPTEAAEQQRVTPAYVAECMRQLQPHMWAAELDRLQELVFSQSDPKDYVVYPSTFELRDEDYVLFWAVAVPGWSTDRANRGFASNRVLDCFRFMRDDVARDMAAALNLGRSYRLVKKT